MRAATAPVRRRRPGAAAWLVPALFSGLVIVVYANPLFFHRNFAGRDLGVYNLPMESAVHGAYARGRFPVWMPEVSGGRPLLPNPNAGALYPVRPILSILPFPLAMRIFPVLHWIVAGLGMIALARALGGSRAGAWIAGVTYVFSGVGVSEVFFPHIHPGMALLPWVVWAVRREFSSAARKVVLLSVLYGLLFLAGDVFTSGIAALASTLWILLEIPKARRVREILVLTSSMVLGALLAAPQIVATGLWIPETNRAVLGMKLRESLFFSIHPLRLVELVVPFPYGACWQIDNASIWGWPVFHFKAMGVFTTLYAGAFAVVALVATRRLRTPGFRFARSLLMLSLLVSVPPSLFPTSWGKFSSPLPLRNPEKFAVAIVFVLALIAGLAVDWLRSETGRRRWPLVLTGILTAAALFSTLRPDAAARLATRLVGDERHEKAAAEQLPRALTEAALLWAATVLALDAIGRRRRGSLAVALALLTAVPLLANRKIARTLTELEVFGPTKFAGLLRKLDPDGSYRTFGEALYQPPSRIEQEYSGADPLYPDTVRRIWIQHIQALWGRGTVFNKDFDVGDLSRLQSLRTLVPVAVRYADSASFFATFSLRWGVRFRDQKPLAGYRRFGGDVLSDWDVLEAAEPDIRLAESWKEEPDALAAVSDLPRVARGEVLVETGRSGIGRAGAGTVRVLRREPERLTLETTTGAPGWLFVLRGFWNHRTVTVDGRPTEYVPAQIAFSAVAVPEGRHRIEWRERVPGGNTSRWGPVIWAAVSALLARSRRGALKE